MIYLLVFGLLMVFFITLFMGKNLTRSDELSTFEDEEQMHALSDTPPRGPHGRGEHAAG